MFAWKVKTWNLEEYEKRKLWKLKHEKRYQIREVFVCNKLAYEYRRRVTIL